MSPLTARLRSVALIVLLGGAALAGEPESGARQTVEGPPQVLVRAGTFLMGASPDEPWGATDEPRHSVTLTRDFWIGATEVTRGEWQRIVGRTPEVFAACGEDCPVTMVSWMEAIAFANALSQRAGLEACYTLGRCRGELGGGCARGQSKCLGDYKCRQVQFLGLDCEGYRLPTEAEWEYAARAGSEGEIFTGPLAIRARNDAPGLDPIAWYGGNSGVSYPGAVACAHWQERQREAESCGIHPVGAKDSNAWGLFDTLGNLMEWVQDRAGWDPESKSLVSDTYRDGVVDPLGRAGEVAILRGGSWYSLALACRVSERLSAAPELRVRTAGLRLARTAQSAER